MPFKPIGNGKYKSPSGRVFTAKQVKKYYATDGFKKKLPSKGELIKEHTKLVKVLRTGSASERKSEAREQSSELRGMKNKVVVNNKLKGSLGETDMKTKRIEINVKKHKGDKAELASTIKHELTHVKHPKMTEREVYKKTAKTKIDPEEQRRLLAKLRMGKIEQRVGIIKKKLDMKSGPVEPGALYERARQLQSEKAKVAIRGLV